jgi:hypothetical protein
MTNSLLRRDFLKQSALAAGAAAIPFAGLAGCAHTRQSATPAATALPPPSNAPRPNFPTVDPAWATTWDAALAVLAGNVRSMPRYEHPVLVEGSTYAGIWLECAPQEGQVYGTLQQYVATPEGQPTLLQTARANHMAFFAQQKEDGQLPASIKLADKVGTDQGYGQIQMVVPIAATAWDIFQATQDEDLLTAAYASCSRWDAWLRQYRDTRKTGLCEGFCTYDTGMDNSPRWKGIPNRCPDADARKFPPDLALPRLCPDLSATVYGGRIALAAMARALAKPDDEARWLADAEHIRQLILTKLYSPEDAAFYDLDANDNFVKVRSVVTLRVLGEHVLNPHNHNDKHIFHAIWSRQIHNPAAFWAPYPFPSSALNEPTFVRPIPRNSWGGASQALTALRAPRWMSYYGKHAELTHLMQQWCSAIMRHVSEAKTSDDLAKLFRQQMDPLTGEFTGYARPNALAVSGAPQDPGGYSPCALVFLDFARRLSHA